MRLASLVVLTLWLVSVPAVAYAYDAHQLDAGSVQPNASKRVLEQADRGSPRLIHSTRHGFDDRSSLARTNARLDAYSSAPRAATGVADDLCRVNSFIPATLVLLADGTTKAIADVQVGEMVIAADPQTGERGPRRVTDTIVGDGMKDLVDIEIDGEVITATGGHPFWVDDQGAWIAAEDLKVGDVLLLADGSERARTKLAETLRNLARTPIRGDEQVRAHVDLEYFPGHDFLAEESIWMSVYIVD